MLDVKAEPEANEAPKLTGNTPQLPNETTKLARPAAPGPQGPATLVRRLVNEMDRLVDDFGFAHGIATPRLLSRGRELLRREAGLVPADWSPEIDVSHRDGRVVVRADLPGMKPGDIKVEVADDILTIEGVREAERREDRDGRHYSERSSGRFFRAIPLPDGAETGAAEAMLKDGVLEVTMPAPQGQARSGRVIPVTS